MQEYKFNSLILKQKFKDHKKFKKKILKCWEEGPDEAFTAKDNYYNDQLLKSDWPQANNWERPWIKLAGDSFYQHLKLFAEHLGYAGIKLHKLWYQQYGNQDLHNWHVHDGNYTGTYYLELDKNSPTTEFLFPDNLNKSFTVDVEEGDMVFFPCWLIHRSARNQSKKTKSIVSWNVDFDNIQNKYLHSRDKVEHI
tara:strand:- start:764 stop:1348 length:585 start_codon:yes stop_codon:yes gene_type:complete